jgi:hypothetical protein
MLASRSASDIATKGARSMIPKLNIDTALAITDGPDTAGYVVKHDREFFAFGADRQLIGEYRSQAEAMRSIPCLTKPAPRRRPVYAKRRFG